VFVRAFLSAPDILLLDDPVSALEEREAEELFETLRERLPQMIVLSMGRAASLAQHHDRVVDLKGSGKQRARQTGATPDENAIAASDRRAMLHPREEPTA